MKAAVIIGHIDNNSNQRNVIYSSKGICPTLQNAMGTGGGNIPLIINEYVEDKRSK